MVSREEILEFAEKLQNTTYDKPFNDDFDTTVLHHSNTKKWFGVILNAPKCKIGLLGNGNADILNLKCDPTLSQGLRETFKGIIPAWHMNKYHWISVVLDSDVDITTLKDLIMLSYSLTGGNIAHKSEEK